MSRTSLIAVLLLLPALAAAQGDPRAPENRGTTVRAPDPTKATTSRVPGAPHPTGDVSVGEVAPGFTLEDQEGGSFKLATERGSWVALCFGDRRTVLAMVDSVTHSVAGANLQVVAIVHENAQALRAHCRRYGLHVRALADHSGEVCMIYGLWDHERDQAVTGLVLVDPQGIIRARAESAQMDSGQQLASVRSAMPGL